jgi:2-iminobutanoate/2-iminopropanoate deaminase
MTHRTIQTENAPKAIGPYAQAIVHAGLVFCSGQIPLDPATGEMVGEGDVRAETTRVMENLKAVLDAAGSSFEHVLKATIYLTSLANFGVVNEVYGGYVSSDGPPARATVEVAALPRGAQVEIELVAALR